MASKLALQIEEPLNRAYNLLNLTTTAALNEDHEIDEESTVEGIHAAMDELKKIKQALEEEEDQ